MDSDGDGVGDACDPEPALPRQQIIFFDPFTRVDPVWSLNVGATVVNDQLVAPGTTQAIRYGMAYTPLGDTFEVGASIGATPTNQYLLALFLNQSFGKGARYCELLDDGTRSLLKYTYTIDGTTYPAAAFQDAAVRHANGSGTLTYAVDAGCSSIWHDLPLSAMGTPPAITTDMFTIYAENVDVVLDYVIQIRTTN